MLDLKSSVSSLRSNPAGPAGVIFLLTVVSAAAMLWCAARGYTFYYGDAEAHVNIARRVLDSRTPGLEPVVAQRYTGSDSLGSGFHSGGRVPVRSGAAPVWLGPGRRGGGAAVRA